MKFIQQIEQYKKLDKLIEQACTGTPDELAVRLQISRTQLYTFLESMKFLGAPIKYNRALKSFYYAAYFKLDIDVNIKAITHQESKTIYGGNLFQKIASVLFIERSNFNLATANSKLRVCR